MDSWLKVLIAAACLVIIGAGGLYLSSAYSDYRMRAEIDRQTEAGRQELFDAAQADRDNTKKVIWFCKETNDHSLNEFKSKDVAQEVIAKCRRFGYLEQ